MILALVGVLLMNSWLVFLASIVNFSCQLNTSRFTREENLSEGFSGLDWPVSMSIRGCLDYLGGRPSPLWVASFPRREVLDSIAVEKAR